MSVITKKEEKFNAVWNAMWDKNDVNEFKEKFKEMYPSDWEKIKATYNREERKDTKHKGHPMPHPEKYLENMYKVGVKKV